MTITTPYIFTTGPQVHLEERWTDGGFEEDERVGAHAIFAARVPFIPSLLGADFTRMVGGGASRPELIKKRQMRFISDLANARDHASTFDLRSLSKPATQRGDDGEIEIVILGKVFHENRREAIRLAEQLWGKLRTHFPSEDPFNYPLEPVAESDFSVTFMPLDWEQITADQLVEIRKYEDMDPYLQNATDARGYFAHPFSPVFHFSALGRFIATLAKQPQACVVSISIRPTALFQGELMAINQLVNSYAQIADESEAGLKLFRQERFTDLWDNSFKAIVNQRNHLFKLRVQIVGEQSAPDEVVEALGSEFMDNDNEEPRRWTRVSPANRAELDRARNNLYLLEHASWGHQISDTRVQRLQTLVTSNEASGAFRLPIPPESGYLPGLLVHDEPFVLPSELAKPTEAKVSLGEIIHRGNPTGIQFDLSARELTRHLLIAGSTGSGKTNTALSLLSQLWKQHRIPFLVMYPIDKPDYRLLMADPDLRSDLLLFTLGDEWTSPFRFNPFAVSDGVLLKTHLSLLLRCFAAAFVMWDPLPAVFREALREVYRQAGWDVARGRGGPSAPPPPTLAEFYETLVVVAERLTKDYGAEARGNVRQGAVIRVGDLVQNLSDVLNVRESGPLDQVLQVPTVFELARGGSSEDVALLMGFLLMRLSEHLQSRYRRSARSERQYMHLTLIEEAHRLMAAGTGSASGTSDPRQQGGEDFSNILAEVRGFNEGIMIAEQIPTSLVLGAVANTHFKVMHWLEDPASFNLFCDLMNLDERQRVYARTLPTGEALVRAKGGQPTHIRVANYLDTLQSDTDMNLVDDSDEAVATFMRGKVALPQPAPAASIAPNGQATNGTVSAGKWGLPCKGCTVVCRHGEQIAAISLEALQADGRRFGQLARTVDHEGIAALSRERLLRERVPASPTAEYCYLARIAGGRTRAGSTNFEQYEFVAEALESYRDRNGLSAPIPE